jgi:serine/threonine-protein kinase
MTLAPGTRLGAYEITAPLGAGGMGEVYRARDSKLNRDVAVKVLPDAFASDPDRLARFKREAHVLASLNHPYIAAIYGFEETAKTSALILELVEGPTLADRIAQGPIPVDEALPIAKQICDALEAAHERGIIHRDLKPANIKLTPDGMVKVLDFGLAKAISPDASSEPQIALTNSPTITTPIAMSGVGVLLGTAAYMSPEQARGRPVDKRTDIWAFGAVLFEMLTGKRPFDGEDVALTLAAIMRAEPDVSILPAGLPPRIRVCLLRCFQKDPKERLRDIGDVRLAIAGAFDTEQEKVANKRINRTNRRTARWVVPITALIAAVVSAAVVSIVLRSDARPIVTSRYPLVAVSGVGPGGAGFGRHALALSPDGTSLAYFSDDRWYLRGMNELISAEIEGVGDARELFFSPDGQSVAFWRDGELRRVALSGGAPLSIGKAENLYGASWPSNDTILVGAGRAGILKFRAEGTGTPEQVIQVSGGELAHGPQLLPGGEWLLLTLASKPGEWDAADIVVQSLVTKERRVLVRGGRDARYVATGHLIYGLNGVLYGTVFDMKNLAVRGNPVPLVRGVMDGDVRSGALHYSVAANGSLVYLLGSSGEVSKLMWTGRDGVREELKLEPLSYRHPRISPDRSRIAVEVSSGSSFTVEVYDLKRNYLMPLTSNGDSRFPLWSPDGERIVFYSTRDGGGLFSSRADGTGTPERWTTSNAVQVPYAWADTGRLLIFQQGPEYTGRLVVDPRASSVYVLNRETKASELLLETAFQPAVSPDGRWIAYTSLESRDALATSPRTQEVIYVRPFPNVHQSRSQVSTDGGTSPLWSPDGKEIFFISRDAEAMTASISTDAAIRPGTPRRMFALPAFYTGGIGRSTRQWDLTADGDRFLVLNPGAAGFADDGSGQVVLVLNFVQELKRLVPVN